MIYALNTRDVSDHERRMIARQIRDRKESVLRRDNKIVIVRDVNVEEYGYYCVYCMKEVFKKWHSGNTVSFLHFKDEGCLGSDNGLPGIENPHGVTMLGRAE